MLITLWSSIRLLYYSKKYYFFMYKEDKWRNICMAVIIILSTLVNSVVSSQPYHNLFEGHKRLELWLDFIQSTLPPLMCAFLVPCDDFIENYNRYPKVLQTMSIFQYELPKLGFDTRKNRVVTLLPRDDFGSPINRLVSQNTLQGSLLDGHDARQVENLIIS